MGPDRFRTPRPRAEPPAVLGRAARRAGSSRPACWGSIAEVPLPAALLRNNAVHPTGRLLMVTVLVIVLVLVAIAGVVFIVGFNRLRSGSVKVDEALAGIDVQLTRRADLIPNLVNTVKGYAAHEAGVLEEVTAARTGLDRAARTGTVPERAAAEARLDQALVNVMAVAEA